MTLADAVAVAADDIARGLTSVVFTTGPSVTADMDALVYGAHGPEKLYVLLLEDR